MPSPEQLAYLQHLSALDQAAAYGQYARMFADARANFSDPEDRQFLALMVKAMASGLPRTLEGVRLNDEDNRLRVGAQLLPSTEFMVARDKFNRSMGWPAAEASWPGVSPAASAPLPSGPKAHRDAVAQSNKANAEAEFARWYRRLQEDVAGDVRGLRPASYYDTVASVMRDAPRGYAKGRRPL